MKQSLSLPEIRKISPLPISFPTDWQAVVFRNYGMVTAQKIAEVLGTHPSVITAEAHKLGLSKLQYNEEWLKKGYITIVRNNWHLLSYRQLMQLLEIDESTLAFLLKEDDFLDVKLGSFKAYVKEPKYFPLNKVQTAETEQIKKIVESYYIPYERTSFDFFDKSVSSASIKAASEKDKIIYSYFALYGDSLMDEECYSYPDYLLEKYAALNINGIWMQGLLYQLSSYPFDENLSKGYQTRRKNLNRLIERCKKYGIKVYLYFNEPRAMPAHFFEGREQLKGDSYESLYSLCTSQKDVKDYLYTATKDLFTACPDLGGIITITMSENLTHCYSRSSGTNCRCQSCGQKQPEEVTAEVNNVFGKAIKDSGSLARVIANLWGWDEFMGWDTERAKRGISLLSSDIDVMLVSENSMKISKGGTKSTVIDYSISNVGPSERSASLLKFAKQRGHKTYAKLQVNNSWECSAVPYIPVYDLIKRHMQNLDALAIDGLMLSWTVGGYPGGGLDYIARGQAEESWYSSKFGDSAKTVKQAVSLFSDAFENYPFDLNFLYNGPHTAGSANLWYAHESGYKSTMVGYPYDDIEGWRGVFDRETLTRQLKALSVGWKSGIELLDAIDNYCDINGNIKELKIIANACYAHFNSSYLLCEFIKKREEYKLIKDPALSQEIIQLIEEERANTLLLYKCQSQNPCIGFEASNHYFYNENTLLEKLINLSNLKKVFTY